MTEKDYSIFAGDKFIESMRSSGYEDTSYAVAELVDNSIDANAKHIEILCQDVDDPSTGRSILKKIAVLDDGNGMNASQLRSALLFGDGTRGDNSKDIGKYGMGLPNSSLSQCKRVEVYSWQNGSKPVYSYIDVDEVKQGKKEIPIPVEKKINVAWIEMATHFSRESGTLVVWSKLDRCTWVTSKKIIEHSEFHIGRIYRKFIASKRATILMTASKINENDQVVDVNAKEMLPNDPLYLMAPTSTPGKWGKIPMFKPDVTPEKTYTIDYAGRPHIITVRYSIEKDELRAPENVSGDQGNTPHGKHARRNVGVSIMRADREIALDMSLVIGSDPRDRWWGVEIDIPSSLDRVVDLTADKQKMVALTQIMRLIGRFGDDDSDRDDILLDVSEMDHARSKLFSIIRDTKAHISSMQRRIRATRAGTRTSVKGSKLKAKIDGGIKKEAEVGEIGESDKDREKLTKEERITMLIEDQVSDGVEESLARERAEKMVEEDYKIIFEEVEGEGSSFFTVQNIGGILKVKINSNHRAYKNLLTLTVSEKKDSLNCDERLDLTKDGLWLLLASWARLEDLTENREKKRNIQNTRFDWGRELDIFLEQNEK